MNHTVIRKLPPIEDIIQEFPLSHETKMQIAQDREEIKSILEGRDKRILMILGPCSAWPKSAVLDYAEWLLKINEKVKDRLKIVMRVYIQKPRSTKGWTGPINQPDVFAAPDVVAGIRYTRDMMIKVIEMGLPIADEALFTHNAKGFNELLSWVAIGARSAEDQEHRIFASSLNCPVGMKNPTHGSLAVAVNSVVAAQYQHLAVFDGHEVQTHGNPHAHLVLRGSNASPNYSVTHLEEALQHIEKHQIKNPAILVDASHDNCLVEGKKNHRMQPRVVFEVLNSIRYRPELQALVKGFMLESYIKDGNQTVDLNHPEALDMGGLSITDPCIGCEATEDLLLQLAESNV